MFFMKKTAIVFYLFTIMLLLWQCTAKKVTQPVPGDRTVAMKLYLDTTEPEIYVAQPDTATFTLMGKHWSSGVFSGSSFQVSLDNRPLMFKEIRIDSTGSFRLQLPRFTLISTHFLDVIQFGEKNEKKEAATSFNVLPGD